MRGVDLFENRTLAKAPIIGILMRARL